MSTSHTYLLDHHRRLTTQSLPSLFDNSTSANRLSFISLHELQDAKQILLCAIPLVALLVFTFGLLASLTTQKERSALCRKSKHASIKEKPPASLDELELVGSLGQGCFGAVSLVAHRSPSGHRRTYALKSIPKRLMVKYHQVDAVRNEAHLLSKIDHPFIVRLENVYETKNACHLLLQPCLGGELHSLLLHRPTGLACTDAIFYASMVVDAFEYLHSRNVVYRDLKAENVLLDSTGYVKLADFGFAKVVEGRTYTGCGTPEYMCPEAILGEGYSVEADWWALGVLLYEMLTGMMPFQGQDEAALCLKIVMGEVYYPPSLMDSSRALISDLLDPIPNQRLGCCGADAFEVKSHIGMKGVDWDALNARTLTPPIKPLVANDFDHSNFDHCHGDMHVAAMAACSNHLPQEIFGGIVC